MYSIFCLRFSYKCLPCLFKTYIHKTDIPFKLQQNAFVNECTRISYRNFVCIYNWVRVWLSFYDCDTPSQRNRMSTNLHIGQRQQQLPKPQPQPQQYIGVALSRNKSEIAFDKTKHGHELIRRILFSAKCLHKQTIDCQMILSWM